MIKDFMTDQNALNRTGNDMINLISCMLNNVEPEKDLTGQIDLEKLYKLAKYHTLTGIVCMALEKFNLFYESGNSKNSEICNNANSDNNLSNSDKFAEYEIENKFKDSKNKGIRKIILLDTERTQIFNFMEKNQIWYMPLKGIILKNMYPKLGIRQMSDNDILFDANGQKLVHDFMVNRGYRCDEYNKAIHDTYHKKPVYNFEMHRQLFTNIMGEKLASYYENVEQRLIKDEGNHFGYHFSDEDFYIFMLSHSYKHFSGSGTGLRTLVDLYVFLEKKEKCMDWKYIKVQLNELGITKYEEDSRSLCKKLFGQDNNVLSEHEKNLYRYYVNAGTYGNVENYVKSEIEKQGKTNGKITSKLKIKYIKDRIFPNEEHYINYAPFFHKHKWLKPVYLIYRILRIPFGRGKRIFQELKFLHRN